VVRGSLLAEIGVGGHGRRNIVNDENQNWWCPTIKQPPPATITSTIRFSKAGIKSSIILHCRHCCRKMCFAEHELVHLLTNIVNILLVPL